MQFIDEATIEVSGGKGGDGVVAWRREKYVDKGGPAGGDGGRGGDVYILASPEINTLVEFRYKRAFKADSGKPGATSNKSGSSAQDLIVRVPVGTLVYDRDDAGDEYLLSDLSETGQRVRVAKGGRGGLGNQHFATSRRQAPRFALRGGPAQHRTLRLELKLLADCGIVGLPNAGKSSLLAAVSAAKPKIADYPFTTLEPQLGVVRVSVDESFVMVDIPGLIDGAHEGHGLGDRFLRHIERTRVLIHLMDGSKTREEILHDKATIEDELRLWNDRLAARPVIHVISKIDLPDARERFEELKDEISGLRAISSATGEGLQDLVYDAWQTIGRTPPPEVVPESATPRVTLTPADAFTIVKDGAVFVIKGERVEHLAAITDFENDEALGRFETILNKLGVERKLRDLGAREGDTVRIGTFEFDYS
jgi:GTP-binding protein